MADSSTGELCEKSDSSEKGTSGSAKVSEGAIRIEAANDPGDIIAHDAANVGTSPADEVNGAAALATPATPPSLSDFDNFGAELLFDGEDGIGGVIREFKGGSIYSEVSKSNFAPSNFQASFMLGRRDSQSVAIVTYLTPRRADYSFVSFQLAVTVALGGGQIAFGRNPSPLSVERHQAEDESKPSAGHSTSPGVSSRVCLHGRRGPLQGSHSQHKFPC